MLDLKTGKTHTLAREDSDLAYASLSPDGSRVAVGSGQKNWECLLVPVSGGEMKPAGRAFGRLRGWTPDGRYVLVWRATGPNNSIGVFEPATGKAAEIAAKPGTDLIAPRLSPDGKWLLFSLFDGEAFQLMLAPFHGSQSIPESEWKFVATNAPRVFWSPDGRSIYYMQTPDMWPTGAPILRQPFDPATGHLAGPATEFYRLEGFSSGGTLTNTLTANRDQIFMTVTRGSSDIWMTELP